MPGVCVRGACAGRCQGPGSSTTRPTCLPGELGEGGTSSQEDTWLLTGDSAIPVIPDEIAARALACQEVGAARPGRGRGWPEKSLANSFPNPSCLSPGDLDVAVGRVVLSLGWRKDSSAQ